MVREKNTKRGAGRQKDVVVVLEQRHHPLLSTETDRERERERKKKDSGTVTDIPLVVVVVVVACCTGNFVLAGCCLRTSLASIPAAIRNVARRRTSSSAGCVVAIREKEVLIRPRSDPSSVGPSTVGRHSFGCFGSIHSLLHIIQKRLKSVSHPIFCPFVSHLLSLFPGYAIL